MENGKCRIGETFACARCGAPVVRQSYIQKYCPACARAKHMEDMAASNRRIAQAKARRPHVSAWARRHAEERVASMLRRERLLSEIGRDRQSRVYVWRDCVVEWRGTAPSF